MRVALGIEYNGSAYCGWQFQDHSPSVQAEVEQALSYVANHEVRVICAGRTDTGVHACNQVIHFDSQAKRDEKAWVFGANTRLPDDISVLWARPVEDSFHARFSATRRRYRYVILNRRIRPGQTSIPMDGGLDFSLDEQSMAETTADTGGDLDFSMDLDNDDEPTATDIQLEMSEDEAADSAVTGDGLDFDLNIDEDLSDVSSAGLDMNLDASDAIDLDMPTGADEVGTKLDLARAYIDMGDPDGARSILDEVIDEGNDGQKQEAEQLMAQIG